MRAPPELRAALVLAAALAGCAGDGDDPGPTRRQPDADRLPDQRRVPTPATQPPEPEPSGGTAEDPAAVEETTALLDWKPVPGSVDDTVTVSGTWTLGLRRAAATGAVLDGPAPGHDPGADAATGSPTP